MTTNTRKATTTPKTIHNTAHRTTRGTSVRTSKTPASSAGKNPDLKERSRFFRRRRTDRPATHPRLRQRAAEVRRRPWWIAGIATLVLALVGGVIFLFGFSSVFVAEEVVVTGAEGEIADGAHEVGAASIGRPLARVDTDRLEEQVMEDLRIDSVDVGRSWPSTITLDLTLREPALTINQRGSQGFQLADAQGVIYDTVGAAPEGITVVRAPAGDLAPEDLRAVQSVPAALPPALADQAEGLRLTGSGEIQFSIGSIRVTWGDGSSPDLKARALQGLLEQDGIDPEAEAGADGEPVTIDLTTPTTAVVTGLQTADPAG